jgi:hypothetical protein
MIAPSTTATRTIPNVPPSVKVVPGSESVRATTRIASRAPTPPAISATSAVASTIMIQRSGALGRQAVEAHGEGIAGRADDRAGHRRAGLRRSGDASSGDHRGLGAIERQAARHDPDRRHEHSDPDHTRRDALVPALAVTAAQHPLVGRLRDWDAAGDAFECPVGLLVISGLHRELQGRPSMGRERADGGGRDPEDLGSLLAPEIEEIKEHERGALTPREFSEGADDLVAEVGGGEGILGLTGAQCPLCR